MAVKAHCGFASWTKKHMVPGSWFQQNVRDFDLWIFCRGKGKLTLPNSEIVPLERGAIVWLRPGVQYEAYQDPNEEPLVSYWIHHDLLHDGKILTAADLDGFPHYFRTSELDFYEIAARKYVWLARSPGVNLRETKQRQIRASHLLKVMLMEFTSEALTHEKRGSRVMEPDHMNLVYDMIKKIYGFPEDFSRISDLRQFADYSDDYFSRLFRKVLGKSVMDVIIEARVHKAKNLLLTTRLTLGEIAYSCGYENVFYFSNQFKNKTGVSPSSFRKSSAGFTPVYQWPPP